MPWFAERPKSVHSDLASDTIPSPSTTGEPMKRALLISTIAVGLALAACSSNGMSASSSQPAPATSSAAAAPETSAAPDPVVSEEASDPVVEDTPTPEPSETSAFQELAFGDSLSVTVGEEGGSAVVTLGKPKLAKCQYSYSGCEKPDTGDRVVQVPILIENGDVATEWNATDFILEFADGTQMEAGDGAAIEYQPDNAMSYGQKIRPNAKYKSVIVFEAPKGPFKVLILDAPFDGEPFAAWG